MNPIIDAIYRDQQVTDMAGNVHCPFPVSIKRNEGEALYHVVRITRPNRTLEVGAAWGLSSLFICQALADNNAGTHLAIDPYQSHYCYMAPTHIQRAGLSHLFSLLEQPSQTVLARFTAEKQSFDFIFIDGSHLFDAVFVDFYFADLLIPVGGILMFDDLWMPAVRKTLNFILTNRSYRIAEEFLGPKPPFLTRHLHNAQYQLRKRLHRIPNAGTPPESRFHLLHNVNWTVLQKTAPDSRPWNHFQPF